MGVPTVNSHTWSNWASAITPPFFFSLLASYNSAMKETISSLKDMEKYAERFLKGVAPNTKSATVVALSGDLGSGKTTFVQYIARSLGITDSITSPTFVIEKVYGLKGRAFKHLVHIDAYRLKSGEDLKALGWDELARDPNNIIFIEWAELVEDVLPKDATFLSFKHAGETTRLIEFLNTKSPFSHSK